MKPPGKAGCPLFTFLTLLTCHDLHLRSIESIGVFDEETIGFATHGCPAKGSVWRDAAWLNPATVPQQFEPWR